MIICLLNEWLEEKDISASALSRRTGISRPTLTTLVNNKGKGIQFDTLEKLCVFLHLKFTDLFVMVNETNSSLSADWDDVDFSKPQKTVISGSIQLGGIDIDADVTVSITDPYEADIEFRPSRSAEESWELSPYLSAFSSNKEIEHFIDSELTSAAQKELEDKIQDDIFDSLGEDEESDASVFVTVSAWL